jgi:hypothetical protein
MRQILVERARGARSAEAWAGLNRVSMSDSLAVAADPESMLPALDEALTRLEKSMPSRRGSSNCASSPASASRRPRTRSGCHLPR